MREHHPWCYVISLTTETRRSTISPVQNCEETRGSMAYRPLPPNAERTCDLFDCGDDAVWEVRLQGDRQPILALCDRCRQEWVRYETAYTTPDGWDWDDDEGPI
jgi:hypothetical protein